MSAVMKTTPTVVGSEKKSVGNQTLTEKFARRRSSEVVIAFAGPIGCGIRSVIDEASALLIARGYVDIVRVKLSDFIQQAVNDRTVVLPVRAGEEGCTARFKRYRDLQDAGKALRKGT